MLHGRPIQSHLSAYPAHPLFQPIMATGKVPVFFKAKPSKLIILQLYLYLQMEFKFVIKEHESIHVPEGISAKKNTFFIPKKLSCEVVTRDICLLS
jgi:hypothetical protein